VSRHGVKLLGNLVRALDSESNPLSTEDCTGNLVENDVAF
jgi:hypothetical protein